MRTAIPALLFLLSLTFWNAVAQAPTEATPGEEAPMLNYGEPKTYTINDVQIFGVKYLDTNILTASTGLHRGEQITIPGESIAEAITRLWNQRYFSDVKVIAEFLPEDKVNIQIYLAERPRVYSWNFEGIRKGEASTLTENLKLKRGTELSDYALEKNITLIKKHFIDKGFRNVEVRPRIENDSGVRNAVNVTFVVNKHNRVKIGAIGFEGNNEFDDKRLRRAMKKTHQVNLNIFQSFKFN